VFFINRREHGGLKEALEVCQPDPLALQDRLAGQEVPEGDLRAVHRIIGKDEQPGDRQGKEQYNCQFFFIRAKVRIGTWTWDGLASGCSSSCSLWPSHNLIHRHICQRRARNRRPTSRRVAASSGWIDPSGSGPVFSSRLQFCAAAASSIASTSSGVWCCASSSRRYPHAPGWSVSQICCACPGCRPKRPGRPRQRPRRSSPGNAAPGNAVRQVRRNPLLPSRLA